MFKTLAAYGQVVGIASLFPYKWPRDVLDLFEAMDTVTSVSDRILNTDCALESRRGQGLAIIYEKAILYMLSPLVFFSCAASVLVITHFCFNSNGAIGNEMRRRFLNRGDQWARKDTKRCLIVSVIVFMVILHPTLVRQSMFLLMCVEVEDSFYLRKDVQLQCGTTEHNMMVVFVAIPGILAYVFLWPYSVFMLLYRRRHKLHLTGIGGHVFAPLRLVPWICAKKILLGNYDYAPKNGYGHGGHIWAASDSANAGHACASCSNASLDVSPHI